jgi:protoheme ferro-lyase
MIVVSFLAVALVSFGGGYLLVRYFTVDPIQMSIYLLLVVFSGLLIAAIVWKGFQKSTQRWIAIGLVVLFFSGGYSLQTRIFLNREDAREVPVITRSPTDPGDGHTAVVYFTHGEPELYDPIGWINQFNEFEEQGIAFVPFVAKPLFVNNLRNHYLIVGRSNHRSVHHAMLNSLKERYQAEGDDQTKFYISFLDDSPRPDAAVIQALNDGASQIIVAEVFLTISNHTAEGKHLIEELNVEEKFNVPIYYTGPMYDSARLKEMFLARTDANIGDTPKDQVGILLVGHGQPDEWDMEWATETEQEISFRKDILTLLSQNGYKSENMDLAWMEFKEPEPKDKIEEFYANGVKKVVYFSAAISADAIHSQYDTPLLINQAKVPDDFPLINLGAWNDDPIVIDAIKEKVDAQFAMSQ